jgi:hypothetical protein
MKYLITTFPTNAPDEDTLAEMITEDPRLQLFTFDHVCNGTILAQGEDPGDTWYLVVTDNDVRIEEIVVVPE